MPNTKRYLGRASWVGVLMLLVGLLLAACGDNTNTSAPAATTAAATTAASATTAAATTAATSATTAAATTAASATTAAGATTAAATTAAVAQAGAVAPTVALSPAGATTAAAGGTAAAAMTPNSSISGNVRIAIAPSSPEESAIVDNQLAQFAKLFPNIKVTKETIASDYLTKIQTEIAGGNAPDIFYVDSLPAPDLISAGVLEPLDSYISKYNVDVKDFYPALIKAYTGSDGKLYGLPKDHNPLGMFYNKDMLQQAGIANPPKTWDELKTALTTLKSKMPSDGAPLVADPAIERILPFVYQAGGSMISADGKSSVVTSDAGFRQGLEFYYNLHKDGLSKKSSEVGADWPGDALSKGKAAIVFEGGWLIPVMDKSSLKDKYGIAELPKGTQQGDLDFTVGYVMSAKAKDKDASFELLNYLTSAEGQKLLTDAGLALPSRQSLVSAFTEKFPARKPLLDATAYSKAWQFGVGFGSFADKVNPSIQGLFAGNKTVDQTLKDIDNEVKSRLNSK